MKKSKTGNKCVYIHSIRGKVFYVGKGSIRRASMTRGRPAGWYKACPNLKFTVKICAENLTQSQANKLEEKLYLKHCGSALLTNKPILSPGINSLEQYNWNEEVLCKKLEAGVRTIDVPWMMLDSYNLPGQPFRIQITLNGVTKRMFSEDLEKLFGDFSRYAFSPAVAVGMFSNARRANISQFISRYAFWIKNGSKRFMQKHAEPARYRATLDFYIQEAKRFNVGRIESQRKYHADCSSDSKTLSNHKKNLTELKARFFTAFGTKPE